MKLPRFSVKSLAAFLSLCFSAALTAMAQTNLGRVDVGSPATATVTVNLVNGGAPATISTLTLGAPNLDYANGGGGTCATGTAYSAGATCTVEVNFTPKFPGARFGAVVLADANNVLGTAYVQGTGVGPQTTFQPAPVNWPCVGIPWVLGIALDGNENLYLVSGYGGTVGIWVPGNPNGCTPSNTNLPAGAYIAVDGAGNLYQSGVSPSLVVKSTRQPGGSYTQTTIASGLVAPGGIAVDGGGNVYFADGGGAYKETLQADGTYAQSTVQSGLSYTSGLAVDGDGNVYVDDIVIYKNTPAGDGYTTSTIVNNSIYCSQGIALDAHGDIYIADNEDPPTDDCQFTGVVKETPGAEQTFAPSYMPVSLEPGWGVAAVALDAAGDLMYGGPGNLNEVEYAALPWLAFAPTNDGAISSDSPQTVSITNDGNADLKFSGVHIPVHFTEKKGVKGECTAETMLAAGATCSLTIEFTPVEPNTTGVAIPVGRFVTITTNTLNSAAAVQRIAVTGSITTPQKVEFTLPETVTYGVAPIALTAKGGGSGNPVTFAVESGPGRIKDNTLVVRGAGTIVVTASQAGSANYGAFSLTRRIIVEKAPLIVEAKNASRKYGEKNPAFSYTFSGFVDGNIWLYSTSGKPELTTKATEKSPPGRYPIYVAVGTLAAPNYRFVLKDGTLTVAAATKTAAENVAR